MNNFLKFRFRWEDTVTIIDCQQSDRFLKLTPLVQVSCTKVFSSGGSFQDVCGELLGVVQDHPVQSPPFTSRAKLLWIAFRYPADIDFRSNHIPYTSLYGICRCLIVGSEYIARSNATYSNKTLTLFSAKLAFRILSCVWIFMFMQDMKTAEKQSKKKKEKKGKEKSM